MTIKHKCNTPDAELFASTEGFAAGDTWQCPHCSLVWVLTTKGYGLVWAKDAPTPVLFKVFEGTILALFPTLPGTYDGYTCLSYQTIGQHGAASVDLFKLPNATPEQYKELHAELSSIGYNLKVCKRMHPRYTELRRAALKENYV